MKYRIVERSFNDLDGNKIIYYNVQKKGFLFWYTEKRIVYTGIVTLYTSREFNTIDAARTYIANEVNEELTRRQSSKIQSKVIDTFKF